MSQTDHQHEKEHLILRAESAESEVSALQAHNEQLEGELHNAEREADIAKNMKSRFLANISHEIRTPMNGILGMTELLLSTELDDSQKRFAQSIAQSTESLLFIVNDVLDFSSLQQGPIKLQENLFFFHKVILDVCDQFEPMAAAKKIKLTCNLHNTQSPSPVIGDEFRIRQILSNLVDNAIKFTEKGEVSVTEVSPQRNGMYGVIVEDSGQGISPDVQDDIFKSFSQGDNSSTRRFGGTGLGLSIANALARQMNGEISIKSEVNKGSAFKFTCELKTGDNEAINEIGKREIGGKKVLVVDDTETNREILSLQLNQWDLDVHCAESGKEALKILNDAAVKKAPFNLAILDLNMPNMDGLELANHIQNAEFSHDLRVMMLTSSVVDISDEALKERGIIKSMLKPARQALLYATVSKILSSDESMSSSEVVPLQKATRILLTEDDPINQEVATIMLESMGYEVVIAENGAAAVDALLQDNNFDLVLMDCQMPVMDGFNATRAIRDNNPNIPIVALTANATSGDKEQCINAGMNDYLTKPIYRTDLSRVVHQWASNSGQNQKTSTADDVTEEQPSESTMNIEIDESALDAIRALQRPGKPDILARIVNMYVEKSPELISAIEEGVAANDCDKVKMAAHTLKSSSAYVGASALAEVCSKIESKAVNGQLTETAEDISRVNSGFHSVVSQIKQYG